MEKITSLLAVLVVGFLILSGFGAVALNGDSEKFDSEVISYNKSDFTHTVLGEFGTSTTCVPCKYAHQALKEIYACEWYPFYYVTLVSDKNNHALQRTEELNLFSLPTVFFDGGYEKVEGAFDKEWAMGQYNQSIELCGNRDVADIDLSVDVEWLGAVNPVPADGETNVSVCSGLSWNLSAMNIDISVVNNELSEYSGHLHVYVTELGSSYWLDKFNNPYTFAFLDYAWNEDIEISAGSSCQDSMEWDGADYDNGYSGEDQVIFYDIWQDNTMIVASVFDGDTNYTDETAGVIAGINTCPKIFNFYFGNYTPPPLVLSNVSSTSYQSGILEWNTTYYWKVDVIDNQGHIINGTIWSFTTRGNDPPNIPTNPDPNNGETDVDVDINISWSCNDPDGDDVFYDIYFGKTNPPPEMLSNQSKNWYDPEILDFNATYYWQIVAWDEFEYSSVGPLWSFTTEENLPPNTPDNPHPPDGVTNAPVYVTLRWTGGDPNSGDIVTYDVYLGNGYPPHNLVSINKTETYYEPTGLELNRTYFWSIVAWDSQGLSSAGPCWLFKTAINSPPSAPNIQGPKIKSKSKSIDQKPIAQPPGTYNYTFKAIDPDNDNIYYYIDWGDGSHEDWFGPFPSGEEVVVSHTWVKKGMYSVKAKAKDIYDQEGPWGAEHIPIRDPKNNLLNLIFNFLEWLINQFSNIFLKSIFIPIF